MMLQPTTQLRLSVTTPHLAKTVLAWLVFSVAVGLVAHRTKTKLNIPGQPDEAHWGMCDFRDAIYYPLIAFLDGRNPYDIETYVATYPVQQPVPLYSPLTFLIHLPFGALPFEVAEHVYFCCMILLALLLSLAALKFCDLQVTLPRVLGLATLIVLCRPGQVTLVIGQPTFQVVLATLVALHFAKDRPWLAGLALGLATFKPNFGGPLAVLMFCRGNFRAVTGGALCGGLGALLAVAFLVASSGGVEGFVDTLITNQLHFEGKEGVAPTTAAMRLDALPLVVQMLGASPGTLTKLAVTLFVLGATGAALFRLSHTEHAHRVDSLSGILICLAVLLCIYHKPYDALLLVLPLVAVSFALREPWRTLNPLLRWSLVTLLAIPAFNYLASESLMTKLGMNAALWTTVTLANSLSLTAALTICLWLAFTLPVNRSA